MPLTCTPPPPSRGDGTSRLRSRAAASSSGRMHDDEDPLHGRRSRRFLRDALRRHYRVPAKRMR